jgi:hypothetical protein
LTTLAQIAQASVVKRTPVSVPNHSPTLVRVPEL